MRILHTSDWHLGRSFHREGMLTHQAAYVDHLLDVVETEQVDLVVVAGDVYDRALPHVDAVRLADEALARLAASRARVVITSGNHDLCGGRGQAGEGLVGEVDRVDVRQCPVVDVAGDDDQVDPLGGDDLEQVVDVRRLVAEHALPVERPAEVPVGRVEDAHVLDRRRRHRQSVAPTPPDPPGIRVRPPARVSLRCSARTAGPR